MAIEMLDREFREDQSAILSNEISRCMIQNKNSEISTKAIDKF